MIYSIFRNNILVTQVKPSNNSELSQKKQEQDIIRLNFTLEDFVDIKIGDYISFPKTQQLYFINKKPRVTEAPKNNQYECIFEGSIHELRKTKVFLTTPKEGGGSYQDYKFPLTGNAETFLLFIVDVLNTNGTGYTVGKFKDTGTSTLEFNNWDVFEAIQKMADVLDFSWYLEGKIVNFDEKGFNTAYTFQVGRLKGFTKLTRIRVESEAIETVVYGYGGTANLPPRIAAEEGDLTYDSELLTENRLFFVGVNGKSKLENNVDLYGRIESVQEFNDIVPERTGEATAIDEENVQIFFDTGIEFDINEQLLAGINPKIKFLTGSLLGLTFNIAFDNETKQITMDYFSDETGQYPNDAIKVAIGDQYKLFDIVMPNQYIVDATLRLKQSTQAYTNKQSTGLELYEGGLDQAFIQGKAIVLDIGDLVRIVSSNFLIDNLYEIKQLTQKIINIHDYSIKFGDILPKGLLASLKNAKFTSEQEVYNIEKNTYTTNETNNQVTNIVNESAAWE